MTAAHELAQRGARVTILERQLIPGGKARSILHGPHSLPGEHGFRFFPGFYKHVIDTMERIPLDGKSVAEHIVPTTRVAITQYNKPTYTIPAGFPRHPDDAGTLLRNILLVFTPLTGLTPTDFALFGSRIWQILTSCRDRRRQDYERVSWWKFLDAEPRSLAYQKFLAEGITRSLVAAKARTASTHTIGDIFIQLMLDILDPTKETSDRVLDGPTNSVWIDPWKQHLQSLGVNYIHGAEVDEIHCDGKQITGITYRRHSTRHRARAEHYIAALPIERIAPLLSPQLLRADPSLANLLKLAPNVEWMNGVQFYLRRDIPLAHGHVIHIDTEWALTSISQLQFWRDFTPTNPEVQDILSVDISDFTAPSPTVGGRTAMQCSRNEVIEETWRQLKRSVPALRDADLICAFLDPDIQPNPMLRRSLKNDEPLLVNLINTWSLRPQAHTSIPNLYLASDYVQTETNLATMEAANEAARRTTNALLKQSTCKLWPLHEPPALTPWRNYDAKRFHAGKPWDAGSLPVAAHIIRDAAPILDLAAPIMAQISPFAMPIADILELQA